MPKITGLGAGSAPANTDVLVLVSNTAGTASPPHCEHSPTTYCVCQGPGAPSSVCSWTPLAGRRLASYIFSPAHRGTIEVGIDINLRPSPPGQVFLAHSPRLQLSRPHPEMCVHRLPRHQMMTFLPRCQMRPSGFREKGAGYGLSRDHPHHRWCH